MVVVFGKLRQGRGLNTELLRGLVSRLTRAIFPGISSQGVRTDGDGFLRFLVYTVQRHTPNT